MRDGDACVAELVAEFVVREPFGTAGGEAGGEFAVERLVRQGVDRSGWLSHAVKLFDRRGDVKDFDIGHYI